MATGSRRVSKMPLTTQRTPYATFTETFLYNPFLLSSLLSFLPWRAFLALSQTSKFWRNFLEVSGTKKSGADSQRRVDLRNVVLTRYVDGFGKVLREGGPESLAMRENFELELHWEDLVLLLISQQTPLHTYPTYALSFLSSTSVPESSRKIRGSIKAARLARLTLAHSRFVLLLQSIAHSSPHLPPLEDDLLALGSHATESSRGHQRASSAGSVRELVFPAPLAAHSLMQGSRSMTNVSIIPPGSTNENQSARSRVATDVPNTLNRNRGSKASSASLKSSFPASASMPSISISPPPTLKNHKRLSVASLLKRTSPAPPVPVIESRALRAYSSSFGWRRGLSEAKGKWEANSYSYKSGPTLDETVGYGSEVEVEDEELFSTPRRRFVGSDPGVSGSESSFGEGTSSTASSSGSNSTSATSVFGFDSPPPIPLKDVSVMNRGRVRPLTADSSTVRSGSASRSRRQSASYSDVLPHVSGSTVANKSPRTSTASPSLLRVSERNRERLISTSSMNGHPVPNPSHSNPHDLRLATSRIRAPVLRVFVPTSDMSLSTPNDFAPSSSDDGGVARCEEELLQAGLWEHLSVGDVVCNLGYVPLESSSLPSSQSGAVWLIYNGSQLIPFAPGAPDNRGVLPVYATPGGATNGEPGQAPWTLPSWGYYEHLLQQEVGLRNSSGGQRFGSRTSNMRILLSKIPMLPHHIDMVPEPTLISVPMRVTSPHTPGGVAMVKKWVWTMRVWVESPSSGSKFSSIFASGFGNEFEAEIGMGWEGEWVLEGDGTKEGREMLLACLRKDEKRRDLMEWEVVRDRCGRRRVWLRLLNSSVSAPRF